MIIQGLGGTHTLHICASFSCYEDFDKLALERKIPIFYSERHAQDCGWVATTSKRYCKPDQDYAWVCPECSIEG